MLYDQLYQYLCLAELNPGLSTGDLMAKMTGDLDPRLIDGVNRGIDPAIGHGQGRVDKRFLSALALSKAQDAKIRVHNRCVALSKGEVCDHKTMYKSDSHLYVFRKVREWHDNIQRDVDQPAAQTILGLTAGRELKDELIHAMQDELNRRYS